jgi:tetratricopeptide (TPR) repeat protein
MGKDPQTEPTAEKTGARSTVYFITGVVFLFLMALLSSLDASFVYIFLGAAVFFFFMGFRNRVPIQTKGQRFSDRVRQTYRSPSAPQETPSSDTDDFTELLRQAQRRSQAATPSSTAQNAAGKKVVLAVIVFISSIFFIIILSVAFLSPENDEGSTEISTTEYVDDFTRAEDFYRNGQFDSAYINYKRVLREDPDNAGAMVGYGSTLYMMNYPDSALQLYDRALSLDPDYDLARYNKAWVYNDRKDYSRALSEVQNLIRKTPTYYEAFSLQGDIYYNQGEYQRALGSYETAYSNGMSNNALCKTMGDLYVRQGNNQKAINFYKEALTYDSSDVYSYQRLGEVIPGEEGNYYRTRALQGM